MNGVARSRAKSSWSLMMICALFISGVAFLLAACDAASQHVARPAAMAASTALPTSPMLPVLSLHSGPDLGPALQPATERFPFIHPVATGGPGQADLEISFPEAVQAEPGGTFAYTLTMRNHGPGVATGVVLTHVLPSSLAAAWVEPAQPQCAREGSAVHCDLGQMAPGEAALIGLELAAEGGETTALAAQPSGASVALSGPACTLASDGLRVACQLLGLEPGTAAQVRVGARANNHVAEVPTLSATVRSEEVDPEPANNRASLPVTLVPPTLGAGSAQTTTRPPDLALQARGPATIRAGEPVTYTHIIRNQGEAAASGVTFRDAIPSDMDLLAYAPALPRCQQAGDVLTCTLRDPNEGETLTLTVVITGHGAQPMLIDLDPLQPGWPICTVLTETSYLRMLTCDLGSLEPGQASRVEMVMEAIGVVERTTQNVASVVAAGTGAEAGVRSVTTTITIQVRADLALTAEAVEMAQTGESLLHTLAVTNLGPSDADDVMLTDELPPGVRLEGAAASQGAGCALDKSGERVSCDLGRIRGGQAATAALRLRPESSLSESEIRALAHHAAVTAQAVDPNPTNNQLQAPILSEGKE